MAPGGLLDAGSRLTQTLITVPYEREQFRTALREKEQAHARAVERQSKEDRVGYLKDRLATNSQRIQQLRGALASGDQNELRFAMSQLRQGRGAIQSAWTDQKAYESFLTRRENYEKELLGQVSDQVNAGMARIPADQIPAEMQRFTEQLLKESAAAGQYTPVKDPAVDLKLDATSLFKKDPKLQDELDQRLNEEQQLLDQYRRLVGHSEDIVRAQAAAEQAMEFEPKTMRLSPSVMQGPQPSENRLTPVLGQAAAEQAMEFEPKTMRLSPSVMQGPQPSENRLTPVLGQAQRPVASAPSPDPRQDFAAALAGLTNPSARPGLNEQLARVQRPGLNPLALDLANRFAVQNQQVEPDPGAAQQALSRLDPNQLTQIEQRLAQELSQANTPRLSFSSSAPGVIVTYEGAAPRPVTAPPVPYDRLLQLMAQIINAQGAPPPRVGGKGLPQRLDAAMLAGQ
jgi:hypothetical protein